MKQDAAICPELMSSFRHISEQELCYTQRAVLGKLVTVFLFGVVPDLRHL